MTSYVVRLVVEVDAKDIDALYMGTVEYMLSDLGLDREAFGALHTNGKVDARACLQLLFESDAPFGTEVTKCEVEEGE